MKTNFNISRYDKGYLPINFNLKQQKDPSKLTQIILSVNVQGERIRVYSRIRVEPEYWDTKSKRCHDSELLCPRVRRRVQGINAELDEIERKIEHDDHILAERGHYLRADDVRKAILSVTEKAAPRVAEDPLAVMKRIAGQYHSRLNRRGMMGEATTSTTYLMAVGRLENYLKHSERKLVNFNELDKHFFAGFADYLTRCTFSAGGKKKHYTALTVTSTLGAIRNIMHRAYDLELCDDTYYNNIETALPHDAADKVYLTEEEIGRIARVEVHSSAERNVRDMFVIASYTALRISDMNKLNDALIDHGQITLCQTKTKSPVHIPILKEIAGVVERYASGESGGAASGAGFPVLSLGSANVCIKELARRAGITEMLLVSEIRGGVKSFSRVPKYSQISFHTARRSCITNLFKRGYSANFIMTLSGHKSIASFQRYIKSSAEEMSQEFIAELRKRKAIE